MSAAVASSRAADDGRDAMTAKKTPTKASSQLRTTRTSRCVIGSGLEFEDRGAHQLKGVPGEWRLFAVVFSS